MNKLARVIFSGRVQGVWFRAFTSEAASAEGLCGWVRNRPDGSVEALFEGDEESVRLVIEKCRKGPSAAQVENVEISWEEARNEFDSFNIRY